MHSPSPPPLSRRLFAQRALAAALATSAPRWAWLQTAATRHNPFALGVASGEPTPDGMVLWTRLVPVAGEALSAQTVRWELAHDDAFRHIVQKGQATATPELGHSVHVEVQGLEPARWYHYRFMRGDAVSATGRTCTAPAADAMANRLRVVFASCQRWEHGQYAAWRHVCADQPDLVLFLGDYIYESATPKNADDLPRTHGLRHARTLTDYRDRYALYKSDPALQAAHALCPWAVTWDDHEVLNDYAGDHAGPDGTAEDAAAFLVRRSAAWQAFYENMPLRASSLLGTTFEHLQVHRRLAWGRLAQLHLLDDRQYRALQACRKPGSTNAGSVRPPDCAELADPTRTLLGPAQEQWLDKGLADDARNQRTRWSVLAQQTLFTPRHYPSGQVGTDAWDGYPAARSRLLQSVQRHHPRNTVLLGGDIHQNYVCNVHAEAAGAGSQAGKSTPIIASEFCGTSITSRAGTTQHKVDAIVRHNPHVLLARCEQRGYGLADITPQRWTTTLRVVDNVLDAHSTASTQARFVVEDGKPGPVAA